jgi:hypothetical protein
LNDRNHYEQPAGDRRRHAPATARNSAAIVDVLRGWLPPAGTVLEIASGSGEHALAFARAFPHLRWQPSDADDAALASITAWRGEAGLANIQPPLRIDVMQDDWPVARADAVVAINLVHISPWSAALALLDGAARLLGRGAALILYGPWIERGVATAPSNLAFDADLRQRNPEWGLREVERFAEEAAQHGFTLEERRAMPANNLMLLLRRC